MSDLPPIPGLDIPRAKRYSRIRLALLVAGTAWSAAQTGWFALSGRSAWLRRATDRRVGRPALRLPAFVATVGALSWLARLPLSYLGSYRVERRYGLTTQAPRAWFAEQAKGLGIGLVLQTAFVSGAYAVIRRRPRDWWLVLAGATVPVAVTLGTLAPVLIAPLFNRFEPLRDRASADRVRALAERAGVPIADVYQMDMSRQTEKANAFFTGIGGTKRIVLGDTLLAGFSAEEVDGVVAHELGHQVHGDIWRFVALGSALGFGGAYAVFRLAPPLVARTAARTGVRELGDVASLPLLTLIGTALGFVAAPIQGAFSRAVERRTDGFAMRLTGDGAAYARAMARLAAQNLADPDPPKAVVFLFGSHPPIAERIAAAEAFDRTSR